MKPWLPALLLVLGPVLAGCGDDATRASSPVRALPTATSLNTPLPTGWPGDLQLPEGSTVYDSADRGGVLTVDFDTQELAAAVSRFLAQELTAAGWMQGATDDLDDTVTSTWTQDTRQVGIDLEDNGATTEVTIRITDTVSPTPSPSGSASPSPSGSVSPSPSASPS